MENIDFFALQFVCLIYADRRLLLVLHLFHSHRQLILFLLFIFYISFDVDNVSFQHHFLHLLQGKHF